jgi:hypothetical protein
MEKLTYQNGFSCCYIMSLVIYEIPISRARAVFITLYALYYIAYVGEEFNVEQIEIINAGNKN